MIRDFKGIWIPREIWLSKELNIQEKVFLAEIDSLDNSEGCFASNAHFAEFSGLSNSRCSEVIKSLENKKMISIKYINNVNSKSIEKRIIKVIEKSIKGIRKVEGGGIRKVEKGIRKVEGGYSENTEGSNTSFNNTIIKDNSKPSKEVLQMMDSLWESYPRKEGKVDSYAKLPDLIKEYGFEALKGCILNYSAKMKKEKQEKQYILKGSTFFNGRYLDYMKSESPKNPPLEIVREEVYG